MIAESLRNDLITSTPLERVFQKHVVDGSSHFFSKVLLKPDLEYAMRHDLSSVLDISINDVILVGSAKLGFSVKTTSFFDFDDKYHATKNPRLRSDLDVAIVNREFFEKTSREIYALSRHFEKQWIDEHWQINQFYRTKTNLHQKYAISLAKGWLRPDYMPLLYWQSGKWLEICESWKKRINRKICVGFYSDWHYLKHYHMDNLGRLRADINSLGAANG